MAEIIVVVFNFYFSLTLVWFSVPLKSSELGVPLEINGWSKDR